MALSPQELRLVQLGKQSGKTADEIKIALYRYRTGQPAPEPVAPVERQPSYMETSVAPYAEKARESIEAFKKGEQGLASTAFQYGGFGIGAALSPFINLPGVKQGFELLGKGIEKATAPVVSRLSDTAMFREATGGDLGSQADFTKPLERNIEAGMEYLNIVPAGKLRLPKAPKVELPKLPTAKDFEVKLPKPKSVEEKIMEIENNTRKTRELNAQRNPAENQAQLKRIVESNVLPDAVDETGIIRTKQKGGAVEDYIEQKIPNARQVGLEMLQKEGALIHKAQLKEIVRAAVLEAQLSGATYLMAENLWKQTVRGLKAQGRIDALGNIPLAELHLEKIRMRQNVDYGTPGSKEGVKAVSRGLQHAIEKQSKTNIGQVNKELAQIFDDADRIAGLDGKRVPGGRLGLAFAQMTGNIAGVAAGSFAGPFASAGASIVGGAVAKKVKGKLMAQTFGKDTGTRAAESQLIKTEKAKLASQTTRPLNVADPVIGAPKGLSSNPEVRLIEKRIIQNVEAQRVAIRAKDFTLVAQLKRVYDALVRKLNEVVERIQKTPGKQGGFANLKADVVAKGDDALVAEARKYKTPDEFVEAQQPEKITYKTGSKEKYAQGGHEAPMAGEETSAPIWDLTGKYTEAKVFSEDVYGADASRMYSSGMEELDGQAMGIMQSLKGRPNAPVTVYRAVPKGEKATINTGDWVTTVREYAKIHGEDNLGGNFRIAKATVKARDIFTDGNSILEFGYDPQPRLAGKDVPYDLLKGEIYDGYRSQLTDIWNKAQGKGTDLMSEARKYKSAEDFVKAQGTPLFHGGTKIESVGNMRSKWGAFYMTENPTYAKSYGGKDSVVSEMVLSGDAKLADMRNPSKELVNQIVKKIKTKTATNKPYSDTNFSFYPYTERQVIEGINQGKAGFAELPQIKMILKELGYDGQITSEVPFANNYGVWNKNVIKTRSQLTDIWKKANNNDVKTPISPQKFYNKLYDVFTKYQSWANDKDALGIIKLFRENPEKFREYNKEALYLLRNNKFIYRVGNEDGISWTFDRKVAERIKRESTEGGDDPEFHKMPIELIKNRIAFVSQKQVRTKFNNQLEVEAEVIVLPKNWKKANEKL